MTKTQNYQLPQWEASDPLRREDFNDAMEKIDAGINASYVTGSYTGTGVAMANGGQLIELEFTPSFVIISRGWTSTTGTGASFLAAGPDRISNLDETFTIAPNGFRVATGTAGYLNLNNSGYKYNFIAFR